MKLIAHRGLYDNKLEQNTLKSFFNVINNDIYLGFECDIRETKDKKYIINHNAFIHKQIIKNTNYKDLKIFNQPRLIDVLKINTDKIILLEIKDINIDIININKILNKYKDKNIYVMSFYDSVIDKLSNLEHFYKLGILNYVLNNTNDYKYDFICLLDNLTNEKQINRYFNLNKEVFIYGILNDKKLIHGEKCYYIVDNFKL